MELIYGTIENDVFTEKYPFWVKNLVIDSVLIQVNNFTSPNKPSSICSLDRELMFYAVDTQVIANKVVKKVVKKVDTKVIAKKTKTNNSENISENLQKIMN